MRRRVHNLLVALASACALVCAWLAPAGDGSAARVALPAPLLGVNVLSAAYGASSAAIDAQIAAARALHVRVIRTEIPWSVLEPVQGQIEPNALASTDYLIDQASAAGIKVVAMVQRSPCWASSAPAALLSACRPGQQDSGANGWGPSEPATYGSFVAFLASRYGSKLAAIEVWNEPDQSNERYFAGPNKAQRYAALLRAAYTAIKRADPAMTVLGGSFVGYNGAFLRALYAAGIKGYYNGLSVHFYTLTLAALRYTHEVQLANGDSTPLWLTEFGWSSCWPRERTQQEQACVSPQTQAANFTNLVRSLARTPWIAAALVYKLQDAPEEDFGALTEGGARKPSFAALSNVFASPFGRPSAVTVHLSRRGGRVVASGSGPVGDYMQIEAFEGARAVYRTLFTLNRFNGYSIALPKSLGTRRVRVSVFQYWMGAARAASASI